jgi:hypothetical protein
MSWIVRIGQADDAAGIRTQARVTDVQVTEEFGHKDFIITIRSPTSAERTQDKGRIDSSLIEITRGSEDYIVGYIESTENGSNYVKYSGRSFLVLLGYSTSGETDGSTGDSKAEYDDKTGAFIIDDLIDEFCFTKDAELVYSDITFAETFGGNAKLHGKKVYQIVKEMCNMYGKDLWSTATWTGDNVTAKNIHVGDRSRGSVGSPHKTLRGGIEIAQIPVIKYRTDADMVNAIRIMGKGSGKERVTAYYTDATSITSYGTIEADPYYNNMIADIDTALAIGQAIVDAKKEPIAQLHVDPAFYINDLRYGDWVRIIDSYSGVDVTKRIKKITRTYSSKNGEAMELELGEQFNNYENIVRDLTKGDVDPEPEMVKQGGSLRITANDPPDDFIRHDPGFWYDTTGTFQESGKGVCPFWTYANNPATGTYKKALIQISDAGTITYKVGTQYASKTDAQNESVSVDATNTPLGEVILKGKAVGGGGYTVEDVYDTDQGNSYIYRDVRPIIGSSATGFGGDSLWEVSGSETQLITPDSIDMQGHDIIKIANLKGSLNSNFSLHGSNSADTDWIEFLQWDHGTEQILINRNTDLYDASTISPQLKFRVPLDEGYSGFYVDYHSVDGMLRFRNITGDTDVVTFSDTGRVNLIDDLWITKGKEINFGTPNTAYIYQDASTNDLKFYDSVLAATKTLTELAAGGMPTGGVQGDITYHNGTNWVRLAAGSSGNYLKTLGAGNNPIWFNITAGYVTDPLSNSLDCNGYDINDIGDLDFRTSLSYAYINFDSGNDFLRYDCGNDVFEFKINDNIRFSIELEEINAYWDLDMNSKDIIKVDEIKGTSTVPCHLDFRGDDAHRIWYTGSVDNKVQYKTYLSHEFVIQSTDILEVKTTGVHMKAGKYIKSDSGDLELRAPSGSKIKFVIG